MLIALVEIYRLVNCFRVEVGVLCVCSNAYDLICCLVR